MDDQVLILFVGLVIAVILLALLAMPIIALVIAIRTKRKLAQRISRLEAAETALRTGVLPTDSSQKPFAADLNDLYVRVARLEAAAQITSSEFRPLDLDRQPDSAPPPRTTPLHTPETAPIRESAPPVTPVPPLERPMTPPLTGAPVPPPAVKPARGIKAGQIESIIGGRWLGWAAIALILFAVAFFFKYAFDNRWIGELGRVAIGVAAGITMALFGYRYYRRGWRIFSQILTAGGIILLYLSAYAAFGFYHLANQGTAFAYLVILVAETALLALLYEAPAIAIMALIGGFLAPVLLGSQSDRYVAFFGYLIAIDLGALGLLKRWRGLKSVAFVGTHLLFWLWYVDHYHPRKLLVVMLFQTAIFLMFLLAHVVRSLTGRGTANLENMCLLLINPFVFFGNAYGLMNPYHHQWMGVMTIGLALIYAGSARVLMNRSATRKELLALVGVALTFLTLAIPIQSAANWITIGWAVEGLLLLWASLEISSRVLRGAAFALFVLALFRVVFWDTPWGYRAGFVPVFNRYFLSSFVVIACLFGGAWLYHRAGFKQQLTAPRIKLVVLFAGIVMLWFLVSVETETFFTARAAAAKPGLNPQHELWLGQMALSVVWSIYASVLAAIGFVRRSTSLRWAALALFGLTVIKAMLIDIAALTQIYRIIVFFVLGVLLLVVAWGYHKASHSREQSGR